MTASPERGPGPPQEGASALPIVGPRPRDELAAWTNARSAEVALAPIPALADPPAPGRLYRVAGRGVFLRRIDGPVDAPHVWYIHGLAGASTNWGRLAGALSGLSTGLCPDLPGSGRSDPPPRGGYSLRAQADLVAGMIRDISGGRVHLVGNSLGGMVATRLAARHPDLIRTLTLVSPAVPDLRLVRDRGADARLALLMLPGTTGPAVRRLASISPLDRAWGMGQMCFGEPDKLSEEELLAAADDLRWRSELPWAYRSTVDQLRALLRDQLIPPPFSFAATAAKIAVPVLVVWGTRDRLVDVRLSRRTAAAFPRSRLLVLRATGHVAQMERPTETAKAMAALWADADGCAAAGTGIRPVDGVGDPACS